MNDFYMRLKKVLGEKKKMISHANLSPLRAVVGQFGRSLSVKKKIFSLCSNSSKVFRKKSRKMGHHIAY